MKVAAVATVNTITSVASTSASVHQSRRSLTELCVLLPGLLFLFGIGSRGGQRPRRLLSLLWTGIATALLIPASGCGSGSGISNPNLRYSPAGTYQYQVTASSISGIQLSQTVTLNLTVK